MKNLSDYALKGYFTQLKEEMESSHSTFKNKDRVDHLLKLIQKAVSFMEDIYSEAPDLIDLDNSYDYSEMVKILQSHGIKYQGNQRLVEKAEAKWRYNTPIVKKPMQKAAGNLKGKEDNQLKTGTDSE